MSRNKTLCRGSFVDFWNRFPSSTFRFVNKEKHSPDDAGPGCFLCKIKIFLDKQNEKFGSSPSGYTMCCSSISKIQSGISAWKRNWVPSQKCYKNGNNRKMHLTFTQHKQINIAGEFKKQITEFSINFVYIHLDVTVNLKNIVRRRTDEFKRAKGWSTKNSLTILI